MKKMLYVYQNYRKSYSSASLSILRVLNEMKNFEVDCFEIKPLSYNSYINRILNRLPYIRSIHFGHQNTSLENRIDKGQYDNVFIMKGTDLKFETLKRIKKNNPLIQLICFNPDDPFNMASSNLEIISSISLYDIYLIWTRLLDEKLSSAGAKQIGYLPFGVDDNIIYPVNSDYQYDISFVGNGDKERHKLISDLATEIKVRNLEVNVHIFGNNWPNLGTNVIIHGQRNGKDFLETIAATKINLNLLRMQNKNSINMRTFEIPAAKGFMLHEESTEAKAFFSPNEEVVYFSSIEDLVNKCEYYLLNEVERKRSIENCAIKITAGTYSYDKILENCLKLD